MRKQSPVSKALERIVFHPENLSISVFGVTDGIARLSKAGAAEKDILRLYRKRFAGEADVREKQSGSRGCGCRGRSLPGEDRP